MPNMDRSAVWQFFIYNNSPRVTCFQGRHGWPIHALIPAEPNQHISINMVSSENFIPVMLSSPKLLFFTGTIFRPGPQGYFSNSRTASSILLHLPCEGAEQFNYTCVLLGSNSLGNSSQESTALDRAGFGL